MSTEAETSRQRFLRNHEENMTLMRLALACAFREGRDEDAATIRDIIAAWEAIGHKAAHDEREYS